MNASRAEVLGLPLSTLTSDRKPRLSDAAKSSRLRRLLQTRSNHC